MPNADLFERRIKDDNRAYVLYHLKDEENQGEDLHVGTQVRVLEVGADDMFASGYYAKVQVKGKERRIDRAMLMPRKDWERLMTATANRMLGMVLMPPKKQRDNKKKEKAGA